MPGIAGKRQGLFGTNIELLLDELKLAFQWDRPCILVAVNKSGMGQRKAENALERELSREGHAVERIEIDDHKADVARLVTESGKASRVVYYVSGLDRGGGLDGKNAYQALNLGRELFVENQIKVVFWLTVNEAAALPRFAPDFWAFRHRVIEFASPAPHLSESALARLLLWHDGEIADPPAELGARIRHQESLLGSLPPDREATSLRVELYYLLGHLYWADGQPGKALETLSAGASLATHQDFSYIRKQLVNGLAILKQENGARGDALKMYHDLLGARLEDGILLVNTGIALCSVGRNYDGVAQATRATALEPTNPTLWDRTGHLHLLLGSYENALACFRKAIAIDPAKPQFYESLAACYSSMGMADDAIQSIRQGREFESTPYPRTEICEQAIHGNSDQALELLRRAIHAGQVSKTSVSHDPILTLLIDRALPSKSA